MAPADDDPFRSLGLDRQAELSDDDVRAAWRRVATATHPDRADGGDPAVFAAAAAAYTMLRTRTGRSEARADLQARPAVRPRRSTIPGTRRTSRGLARFLGGRPARLAVRFAAAAAVSILAVLGAGWHPASLGVIAGVTTWLALTGRADLAPPPR